MDWRFYLRSLQQPEDLAGAQNDHPVPPVASHFPRDPGSKTHCSSHSTPIYGRHHYGTTEDLLGTSWSRSQVSPAAPFPHLKSRAQLSACCRDWRGAEPNLSLERQQAEGLYGTHVPLLVHSSHVPLKLPDSPGSSLHLPSKPLPTPPHPHPALTTLQPISDSLVAAAERPQTPQAPGLFNQPLGGLQVIWYRAQQQTGLQGLTSAVSCWHVSIATRGKYFTQKSICRHIKAVPANIRLVTTYKLILICKLYFTKPQHTHVHTHSLYVFTHICRHETIASQTWLGCLI